MGRAKPSASLPAAPTEPPLSATRNQTAMCDGQPFTLQQMQGGPRYKHQCRIGNWQEDQTLEQIRRHGHKQQVKSDTLALDHLTQTQLPATPSTSTSATRATATTSCDTANLSRSESIRGCEVWHATTSSAL